jgi:hypothetical protein
MAEQPRLAPRARSLPRSSNVASPRGIGNRSSSRSKSGCQLRNARIVFSPQRTVRKVCARSTLIPHPETACAPQPRCLL